MTTLYVAQAVLHNRVTMLHTAILLVKSREELVNKLADRYNEYKIYEEYIEDALPSDILDKNEPDIYEVESYAYGTCNLQLVIYDKVELP